MDSYFPKQPKKQPSDDEIVRQVNQIIREVIDTEKNIDDLKVTLAENIRFDTADAFRSIDSNQKGYITAEDIFRFMMKNGLQINIKMCSFLIHCMTDGANQMPYQIFLQMIIPKYDPDAAQSCIVRKLNQDNTNQTLTFYLEETIAKLLYLDLEYLKSIEIKKMKLAQTVDWKFMTVYKLISTANHTQSIDQTIINNFMSKYQFKKLTSQDYQMFLSRFNRNNDKLIQRDEFCDAIFPNGYLLQYDAKPNEKEAFERYIKNQNQELDNYLGKTLSISYLRLVVDTDDQSVAFNPDDHRFASKKNQNLDSLVLDSQQERSYMLQNPQQTISTFVPEQPRAQQIKLQSPPPPMELSEQKFNQNNKIIYGSQWQDSLIPYFGLQIAPQQIPNSQQNLQKAYDPNNYQPQQSTQSQEDKQQNDRNLQLYQPRDNSKEFENYRPDNFKLLQGDVPYGYPKTKEFQNNRPQVQKYRPDTQKFSMKEKVIPEKLDNSYIFENPKQSQQSKFQQKDMLKDFINPKYQQEAEKNLEPQRPNYESAMPQNLRESITKSMVQQYGNQPSNKDLYLQKRGQESTFGRA